MQREALNAKQRQSNAIGRRRDAPGGLLSLLPNKSSALFGRRSRRRNGDTAQPLLRIKFVWSNEPAPF